jgi:UDP-glucose-4-epimerase GalE
LTRVLVTGGAGYIGSHTAKALAHSGFEPVVLDDLTEGHRWAVKWGPLAEGNLADGALLRTLIAAHRIDAVIHFAAHAYVGESVRRPREYFHNNVVNTLNLLDALVDTGVSHIVFSSSCASYGIPEGKLIIETHPQRPINPYGESKLFVERALHWYGHAYGIKWAALRYFNAAGADPEGELGEEHNPEPHLIPRVIQAALGELPCVEIYGTDYSTADGTAIRDYVHVTDLAAAHVLALSYLRKGGESMAINLGTGKGYSVQEVISTVERVTGCMVPAQKAPRRPGDPPVLIADSAKAARVLHWRPRHSSLEAIVETAWGWHSGRADAPRGRRIPAGAPRALDSEAAVSLRE